MFFIFYLKKTKECIKSSKHKVCSEKLQRAKLNICNITKRDSKIL